MTLNPAIGEVNMEAIHVEEDLVGTEDLTEKMVVGSSLEASDLKWFLFSILVFPKNLGKKSTRVVKSMAQELAHLNS